MSDLSAWWSLKDAPRDKPISAGQPLREMTDRGIAIAYVGRRHGDRVVHFNEISQYWWYWTPEDPIHKVPDTIIGFPFVTELELDRAVQKAIAEAFGQMIDALVLSAANRAIGNEAWADIQQSAVIQSLKQLHTAFGGRIPDE
ncbi:hypothetical protein OUZ56_032641, partial [Daphnia magna]